VALRDRAEQEYRTKEDLDSKRGMSAVGAALLEEGLSQMGSPGAGKAVGEYLRQEWWRQEANTFQATTGKETQGRINENMGSYKNRTKMTTEVGVEGQDPAELRKGYYSEYDLDGAPITTSFIPADDFMAVNTHLNTAASDMIGGLQHISMDFMDAAGEYPNNPLVEQKAKQLMNHIQSSFEGQLTAAKIAGEQMDQQNQMMEMQERDRKAKLAAELFPKKRQVEMGKLDAELFNQEEEMTKTRAMVARGRELNAADGFDIEALDDNDNLERYYKHQIDIADQIKQVELAKKSGRATVPPGIDLTNVGDWLRYSAPGTAIITSFKEEEEKKALGADPATIQALEDLAISKGYKTFAEIEDPKLQKAIRAEVLNLNPDVREGIMKNAVRNATEYLINTGQLGASFGVGKGNKGVELPDPSSGVSRQIRLFESPEAMVRELLPEEFEEEVTSEVEVPSEEPSEYYSGDPEDPFGDQDIPEDSPLNPDTQQREIMQLENYTDWLGYIAANPKTPRAVKISNAKRAMKDIDTQMDNLRQRQSIYGQGLPEQEYLSKLAEMKTVYANFEKLLADPDAPFAFTPDFGVGPALQNAKKMIKLMMSEVEEGMVNLDDPSYGLVPLGGQRPPGILVPKEQARRGGKTLLGPAIDASVPYWMASPEEKQKRMSTLDKTLKTGIL